MSQTPQPGHGISSQELYARKKLLPGALNLIGAGTLGGVQWLMSLVNVSMNYGLYQQKLLQAGLKQEEIAGRTTRDVAIQVALLLACLFIVWAGMNALVASRKKTVMAGACLALVPMIPWFGFPLGIIGGVWLLVVLVRNKEVNAAIAAKKERGF